MTIEFYVDLVAVGVLLALSPVILFFVIMGRAVWQELITTKEDRKALFQVVGTVVACVVLFVGGISLIDYGKAVKKAEEAELKTENKDTK